MRIEAIRHDADWASGLADELAEAPRGEEALEDEAVGQRRKPALRLDVDAPSHGGRRVVQASAMGRVECTHASAFALKPPCCQPRIGPALGAMAMQDIDVETRGQVSHLAIALQVARAPGRMWRGMGTRPTPTAQKSAKRVSARAALAPPVSESQITPTLSPSSA